MNRNKSLFWYGIRARLMKVIGGFIALIGIGFLVFQNWIGLFIMVAGIIILAIGASKEYDYKRQGGYIVYRD